MKRTVALVLPAYNIESVVLQSLDRVREGLEQFPECIFNLYIIDDASKDDTASVIKKWTSRCGFKVVFSGNKENLGLVVVLKAAYESIVRIDKPDYILKTDLDEDFNQEEVIKTLLPYASDSFVADMVIGNRLIDEKVYSEYEQEKRKEIFRIIKNKVGCIDERLLDPASVGSQLYRSDTLKIILEKPIVKSFEETKGLDFLIPLVAHQSGFSIKIFDIAQSAYDPDRRTKDKIDDSYNAYREIVYLYNRGF